jgi:hypothetical protein
MDALLGSTSEERYQAWRMIIWSSIAAENLSAYLAPKQKEQAYLCSLFKDLSVFLMYASSQDQAQNSLVAAGHSKNLVKLSLAHFPPCRKQNSQTCRKR